MANDAKIIIKREELYERIWATPTSRLAREYRMSDSMLARVCKKLKVPKPPVGYWTKIKHSKRVSRPPLQPLGPEEPTQYEHFEFMDVESLQVSEPEFLSLLSRVPSSIRVSKRLQNPDPLIKNTLDHYKTKGGGIENERNLEHLMLNVYPGSENRALRLLDSLVRCLRKLSCEVRGICASNDKQCIEILGETIVFGIHEKSKRIDHVLTKEELKEKELGHYFHADKWDYVPLGELVLSMDIWVAGVNQKRWADSPRKPLEDKMRDFIIGVISAASALRKQREDNEKAERLAAERRRLKLEEEKKLAEEETRRKAADNHVANWIKSKQLRSFIKEFEGRLMEGQCTEQVKQEFISWIQWANEYANQLDPITATLAKLAGKS